MLGCVIINTDRSELPNLCTAQATRAGTTRADIRAAWGPLYLFHAIWSVSKYTVVTGIDQHFVQILKNCSFQPNLLHFHVM